MMSKIGAVNPDKLECDALKAAFNNHQKLIVAADTKAHNLIQVNGIIISILLALIIHFAKGQRLVLLPVALQLVVSLIVIALCLVVTKPKTKTMKGKPLDGLNLLFFASYASLEEEDYSRQMDDMLGDADKLYGGLIRESYHQAIILYRKYRYLRYAHHVFTCGVFLTVVSSVVLFF